LLHTAELDERLAAALFRRHARAQIVLNMHLEMALHLVSKVAVAPLLVE
jgi:hypothetical protein